MKPEALKEEYEKIFDDAGYIKIKNTEQIITFCKTISELTGIQCCDKYGNVYEYVHEVYHSALKILEDEQ